MDLAICVSLGVEALREGRSRDAIEALTPVATDRELAAATDLRDLRARVLSLLAQAHFSAGELQRAGQWCAAALRILRSLKDDAGLQKVRDLSRQIAAARVAAQQKDAREQQARASLEIPLATWLEPHTEPAARRQALLERASAELLYGDVQRGVALAEQVLLDASTHTDARAEVLMRLALAEAMPETARVHLDHAWSCAAQANETNLVAAIARLAARLQISLTREF